MSDHGQLTREAVKAAVEHELDRLLGTAPADWVESQKPDGPEDLEALAEQAHRLATLRHASG